MKIYFCKKLSKLSLFVIIFISLFPLKSEPLNAEYLFEESQIGTSTKTEENTSAIPNNPFEIVEMIRRNNILNDATNPSDAIDDALKSFMEEE